MEVDTGSFRALTARADAVDALAADVAQIKRHLAAQEFAVERTFDAGYAAGRASTGLPVHDRAAGARHARPRGGRHAHLRLVASGEAVTR